MSDNSLKKLPANPLINRKGKWITIVANDEATIAGNKSRIDCLTTSNLFAFGFSSCPRYICSITTIASSRISPIEAAIAPNDIMFIVIPAKYKSRILNANVTGIVRVTTRLALHALKKITITIRARISPSTIV